MVVEIYAPHKTLFSGKALQVSLPGMMGRFAILEHHAPMVSVLDKGTIFLTQTNNNNVSYAILSGFIEVNNNVVKICVEIN
jgi:F-type H+-transporting ATPase subunit epsilon